MGFTKYGPIVVHSTGQSGTETKYGVSTVRGQCEYIRVLVNLAYKKNKSSSLWPMIIRLKCHQD